MNRRDFFFFIWINKSQIIGKQVDNDRYRTHTTGTHVHMLRQTYIHTHRHTRYRVFTSAACKEVTITHTGIHMSKSVYLSSPWCFRWGADQEELTTIYTGMQVKGCLPQQPVTLQVRGDHHTHRYTHVTECLPQRPVKLQARSWPPHTQVTECLPQRPMRLQMRSWPPYTQAYTCIRVFTSAACEASGEE